MDDSIETEFSAISDMIKAGQQEGLLTEVIWTFSQSDKSLPMAQRCRESLYEWDI